MKRITTLLAASIIALLTLAACGAANPTPTTLPAPSPTTAPATDPTATPEPFTGALPGVAPVDSITINTLESNPVQIQAVIKGYLPTPCVSIDKIDQTRDGNTITVTINTLNKPNQACIEVIQPYEQTVNIDTTGLSAGTYTVTSNGVSATFELNQR